MNLRRSQGEETSPIDEGSKARGSKLALVAVLVVVLGFIAVTTAGIVAWRTGLLQSFVGTSEKTSPVEAALTTDGENTDLAASIEPSSGAELAADIGEGEDSSAETAPVEESPAGVEQSPATAARRTRCRLLRLVLRRSSRRCHHR